MERMELTAQDGTGLFVRPWNPTGDAKAVILHCHGIGEHCGRWEHVASFFNEHGYAFLSYDHRGHGRSKGQRGHIPSYEVLMEELDLVMAKAHAIHPGIPIILYGHSWGGNHIANYLIRRQPEVHGAILTAPWITLPPEQMPSAFLGFLAKVMNSIYPSFTENNKIDVTMLSTDQAVGKEYTADPLVHGKVTASTYIKSSQAGEYALANAAKINVPMLILHGEEDKTTSLTGSRAFAEAHGDGAEYKTYPGMRHEIHNEVEKEKVLTDILAFTEVLLR